MDTKAGSSYAYVALISKLNRNPDQRKYKIMEIMMTWTSQKKCTRSKSLTSEGFQVCPLS